MILMKKINLVKLCYVFLAAAAVLAVISVVVYYDTASFIANAGKTEAEVISLIPTEDSEDGKKYYAEFKFTDDQGNTVKGKTRNPYGKDIFKPGDKVEIYFEKGVPLNFMVNTFDEKWLWLMITVVFTIALLLSAGMCILTKLLCSAFDKVMSILNRANP